MQLLQADSQRHRDDFAALAAGRHDNVFAVLGLHRAENARIVRVYLPHARAVSLLTDAGRASTPMLRVHDSGVFAALMPARRRRYRLRVEQGDRSTVDCDDPYAFPVSLGDLDLYLLREGSHEQIYSILGSQPMTLRGAVGTRFAVWAPNARRASVVGDFNDWDGRLHAMRLHPGNGVWEIFLPGVLPGAHYKFELTDQAGNLLPLKSDPLAHYCEAPPGNASIVYQSRYRWSDAGWMRSRAAAPQLDQPVSVYEVHLGSWRRNPEESNRSLTYRELAAELVQYVVEMGFTHVELLPVTEYPFDGSWGYQPIGLFAPTQRYGEPDEFRYFVDCCHQAGIGVILDWVSAHFPRDAHGLVRFDGTALYEHEDPRMGEHADWGTLIFNYGRSEVINYLIGSALYWIEEFHIDALRVDAVASMLYLDYSREAGEWLPNKYGGNENLDAVAFLRRLNEVVHAHGATTFAEESTAWPGVSRPTYAGGLGFTYKWNMGWMHDTLKYIEEDPVHRRHHHDKMTFSLIYAFDENFVLPLSHDEVVHGKRSLLEKMPGDDWQKFANLRAYLAAMYGHPGKKLLFMGTELAQRHEWSHDGSLEWHLLKHAAHSGVKKLVKALNAAYRRQPALHEVDFSAAGFEWIALNDDENSVLAWLRRAANGEFVACVANFTPVVRHDYALGVPIGGDYAQLLNTDSVAFDGSGVEHADLVSARADGAHGRPYSLSITLPPLATVMFVPAQQRRHP